MSGPGTRPTNSDALLVQDAEDKGGADPQTTPDLRGGQTQFHVETNNLVNIQLSSMMPIHASMPRCNPETSELCLNPGKRCP